MAVPKKKVTRARRGKRYAHAALEERVPSTCPHCGAPKEPHRVCPSCGRYKGRQVLEPK